MKSNQTKSIIINIKIEEGREGLFYATSPDLRGLLVAKPDVETLYKAIPRAIQELYEVCGVRAIVTQAESSAASAEDDANDYQPWIATPYDVAEQAMRKLTDHS